MAKLLLKIFPPMAGETGLWHEAGSLTLEEEILEGQQLSSVLNRLTNKYGAGFREALFDGETGQIKTSLIVTLNSRLLFGENRLETRLADGDTVVLMPPYGGG